MNPSLPVTFTTSVDVHPDTVPSIEDLLRVLDVDARRAVASVERFYRSLTAVIERDGGDSELACGAAFGDTEMAWIAEVGSLALVRARKLAEARSPQAEPSTQGGESRDAGLQSGPRPAPVGSAAASPVVADPTDDRIPDWVQDFADECKAEPGVWFLAAKVASRDELERLTKQLHAVGLQVAWPSFAFEHGTWVGRLEARA